MMEKIVFISHSSADNDCSEQIYDLLERKGLGCWMDKRDIVPGIPYARAIMAGIDQCKAMVVIISSNSIKSDDVLNEIDQAHAAQKLLIPVMWEDLELPRDFSYYLKRRQWIVANGNVDTCVKGICDALRTNLGIEVNESNLSNSISTEIDQESESYIRELLDSELYEKAYPIIIKQAINGSAFAQNALGLYYRDALGGLPRNTRKSFEWFKKAADQNYGLALENIGIMYASETLGEPDFKKALEYFKRAGDLGMDSSIIKIGLIYANGSDNVKKDVAKAKALYHQVIKHSTQTDIKREAYIYLARLFFEEEQYVESKKYCELVIEENDTDAYAAHSYFLLGVLYEEGLSVQMDKQKAFDYYYKSNALDDFDGRCHLASCYMYGIGTGEDQRKAIDLLKDCEGLEPEMMARLANSYLSVSEYDKAYEWASKGVDGGSLIAYNTLGFMYEHGFGVNMDLEEAFEWYSDAAEQGYEPAIEVIENWKKNHPDKKCDVTIEKIWFDNGKGNKLITLHVKFQIAGHLNENCQILLKESNTNRFVLNFVPNYEDCLFPDAQIDMTPASLGIDKNPGVHRLYFTIDILDSSNQLLVAEKVEVLTRVEKNFLTKPDFVYIG